MDSLFTPQQTGYLCRFGFHILIGSGSGFSLCASQHRALCHKEEPLSHSNRELLFPGWTCLDTSVPSPFPFWRLIRSKQRRALPVGKCMLHSKEQQWLPGSYKMQVLAPWRLQRTGCRVEPQPLMPLKASAHLQIRIWNFAKNKHKGININLWRHGILFLKFDEILILMKKCITGTIHMTIISHYSFCLALDDLISPHGWYHLFHIENKG